VKKCKGFAPLGVERWYSEM